MTEVQILFILVAVLGLLAIFGIVDGAVGAHEDRRRRRTSIDGEDLPRR